LKEETSQTLETERPIPVTYMEVNYLEGWGRAEARSERISILFSPGCECWDCECPGSDLM